MIEFYPQIKWVHIATVLASGGLFLLRGLLVQAGRESFAMAAPVRYLSYTIDCVLLTAALMLLTILPKELFANGWLWVKIGLLVVYIVLGTFALKRGRTPRARLIAYVLALAVFGFMFTVARTHHPLGVLAGLDEANRPVGHVAREAGYLTALGFGKLSSSPLTRAT